jgi:hypothetical protein
MPPFMMAASFGSVGFWISSMSGRAGRDVVVKSPARGDAHVLQDRGLRHRTLQCDPLFCDEPERPPPEQRFLEFQRLANADESQIFRHPLDGSYRARVAEFEYSVQRDDREIRVSCTFLAEGEPLTVINAGLAGAPLAGVEEVSATVAAAEAQLAERGLTSEAPRSALDTVSAWTQAETPDTRAVYLQAASLSQLINEEVNRLEMVTDLARWPIYREFIALNYQARRAAEAVTSETSDVFSILVEATQPLRLLCARIYGAALAEDKARQVTQLNGLRTPGLVPAGTRLVAPREGAR